jgi:hypothetical protein
MRQTSKIGIVLLIALTVSLGYTMITNSKKNEGQLQKLVAEKELMATTLSSQESNFNEVMRLVEDVETQIESIVKKENLVFNAKSGEYMGSKEKLTKEIAMIDGLIERSNKSIEALSGKLKSAGLKSNVLQNKISRLTKDLKERTASIVALNGSLKEQEEDFKALEAKNTLLEQDGARQALEITSKDTEISQLLTDNKDLNQVHFVVGTYDELSTKGVLRKEGGFLMFGKKKAMVEEVEASQFSHIDGRQFRGLPFEGDKFEIVSKHPSSSFSVVEDDEQEGKKYLEIIDAEEFWKLSKYLVVSVK